MFLTVPSFRIGPEYSSVRIGDEKYLDRFIFYFFGTIRLHRFWRGDDDRAPHNHPWWFVTLPFTSYVEKVYDIEDGRYLGERLVKAWRFHFRPARYRHMVVGRADGKKAPFWTFVLTGRRSQAWGFWPNPNEFVAWRDWL